MMSCPLLPEIFEIIVDHLHNDRASLGTCCIVSKSWVSRTQRRIFSHIKFMTKSSLDSWMKTFLDPSNSPAHYTRTLSVHGLKVFTRASADAFPWLQSFHNIAELFVDTIGVRVVAWTYCSCSGGLVTGEERKVRSGRKAVGGGL